MALFSRRPSSLLLRSFPLLSSKPLSTPFFSSPSHFRSNFSSVEFHEPVLLTPGPLTTSLSVKQATLHDLGSRDSNFLRVVDEVRSSILQIAGVDPKQYSCVLLQGSGTFAVEATLGTLVPKNNHTSPSTSLVLVNGMYGERIVKIFSYLDRPVIVERLPENQIFTAQHVDSILASLQKSHKDFKNIEQVVIVHSETTSGVINPVQDIGPIVSTKYQKKLIIDAMSSFGVIKPHLEYSNPCFDAVVASSNKCLEGLPGIGFVIVKTETLNKSKGNCHSLSLDLYDQNVYMNSNNNQWRFTPPTHVLLALRQAITEYQAEGGLDGRYRSYKENSDTLLEGMRRLGFRSFLAPSVQGPIIHTFMIPDHPKFDFNRLNEFVKNRGFILYPGKLTTIPTFRIGSIGRINKTHILNALKAIEDALAEMNVAM